MHKPHLHLRLIFLEKNVKNGVLQPVCIKKKPIFPGFFNEIVMQKKSSEKTSSKSKSDPYKKVAGKRVAEK
ncbi:hypothetical protein IB63_06480 [Brucella abortus 544]|nr:hypothetical protein IB63_06480 [Brucella abortus 544]